MTRYFFDCQCDGGVHQDAYGIDLPYDEIADQAFAVVLELMKESEVSRERSEVTVKVRDGGGKEIYTAEGRLSGAYTAADHRALLA